MSKMGMPEMNVVRFTESDVIVASVGLYQFSNGQAYDAYAVFNGKTYHHTSSPSFDDFQTATGITNDTKFYWESSTSESGYGQETWSQLLGFDSSDATQGNATDGVWVYRNGNAGWGYYRQ